MKRKGVLKIFASAVIEKGCGRLTRMDRTGGGSRWVGAAEWPALSRPVQRAIRRHAAAKNAAAPPPTGGGSVC